MNVVQKYENSFGLWKISDISRLIIDIGESIRQKPRK